MNEIRDRIDQNRDSGFDKETIYFVITKQFLHVLIKNKEAIIKATRCKDICWEDQRILYDSEIVCYIKADNLNIACNTVLSILEEFEHFDLNENLGKYDHKISFFLLVPHCMISPLIGKRGQFINKVKEECYVDIYFDTKLNYPRSMRKGKICGSPKDIKMAVNQIVEFISFEYLKFAYSPISPYENKIVVEKSYDIQLIHTKFRFILTKDFVDYLLKKYDFFDSCQMKKVFFTYDIEYNVKGLKPKEIVGTLAGKFGDVFYLVDIIIEKHLEFCKQNSLEESFKILIPISYALNLIDYQFKLLNEICNFVKEVNAKFNALSPTDINLPEYVLIIEGSLPSKKAIVKLFGKGIYESTLVQRHSNSRHNSRERSISRKKHSRSRSRNRSRSRSRSWSSSRSRFHRKSSISSKFRSEKKIYRSRSRSHSREYRNPETKFYKNISFEDRGIMKIGIDILVPKYLTSILIGKNGENIKVIQEKSSASINFSKEDKGRYTLEEGEDGKRCRIVGSLDDTVYAFKLLLEDVVRWENKLNGKRVVGNFRK